MPLSVAAAIGLFVGVALALPAMVLLWTGRRRRSNILLAVFLLLVAVNFMAIAIAESITQSLVPAKVAYVALALDPFFLLAFVGRNSIRRGNAWLRALLVLVGVAGLVSVYQVLFRPDRIIFYFTSAGPTTPERTLLVLNLVVAYAASWFVALRSAVDAPGAPWSRRRAWIAAAIGVTVIPRLGLAPDDFLFSLSAFVLSDAARAALDPVARSFIDALVMPAIMALVYFGDRWTLRTARPDSRRSLEPPLRFLAGFLIVLGAIRPVLSLLEWLGGFRLFWSVLYGSRWIVFIAAMGYGILTFDVPEFRRTRRRAVPLLMAAVGGAGVFLFGAAAAGAMRLGDGVAIALAAVLALASAVVFYGIGERTANTLERPNGFGR